MLYNIQKMWSINDGVKQQCAINLLPLPDDVIHTIKDYVFYTYEQVDMRILKQRLINELLIKTVIYDPYDYYDYYDNDDDYDDDDINNDYIQ